MRAVQAKAVKEDVICGLLSLLESVCAGMLCYSASRFVGQIRPSVFEHALTQPLVDSTSKFF